eukprot:NODE_361_length_8796_cov_0.460274.p5 type:complete len:167 gc:universal NODE_361_length_8796_cov_0.460274:7080-7580(+)
MLIDFFERLNREIENNLIFGEMIRETVRNFVHYNRSNLRRTSGYINILDYNFQEVQRHYFNEVTCQLFYELNESHSNFHFYRTGFLTHQAFERYSSYYRFLSHVPGKGSEVEPIDYLNFDINCCLCSNCNILKKKTAIKVNYETIPFTWKCRNGFQYIKMKIQPSI